jgi:amidohydrolase
VALALEEAKARARQEVERLAPVLLEVSHAIHDNPELSFREHHAHDLLVATLAAQGLEPVPSAYGVETAFEARAGGAGPEVAVLLEYDALPGIGHGCGHNIIAAAGLGAALASAVVADELGGRLRVLGTPAEEGGGGKIVLADRGAFEGLDAALMVHPAGADLRRMHVVAVQQLKVRYTGEASHAAAAPHRGRNALDAAVLGYMNVAALRQHIRPDERIHGIFTEAGEQANIVPRTAAAHWYVRSSSMRRMARLVERVEACLRAGGDAAGVEVAIERVERAYANMLDNPVLVDRYVQNAATLGREVVEPSDNATVVGSTDMGNVSHLVPSIHPMLGAAPANVAIHTEEFARCAAGAEGDRAVLDGAAALAMTVLDCWGDPEVLPAARAAFQEQSQG